MPGETPENCEEDIEQLDEVFAKYMDVWDDLEYNLDDWLDRHPSYAAEEGFFDQGKGVPHILNHDLDHLLTDNPEISSELHFLVVWGYKEGIADVVTELEEKTNVPHEEIDDEADGE